MQGIQGMGNTVFILTQIHNTACIQVYIILDIQVIMVSGFKSLGNGFLLADFNRLSAASPLWQYIHSSSRVYSEKIYQFEAPTNCVV